MIKRAEGRHIIRSHSWESEFSWGGYAQYYTCSICGARTRDADHYVRSGVARGFEVCEDCASYYRRLEQYNQEKYFCKVCSGTGGIGGSSKSFYGMTDDQICHDCGGAGFLVGGVLPIWKAIEILEMYGKKGLQERLKQAKVGIEEKEEDN